MTTTKCRWYIPAKGRVLRKTETCLAHPRQFATPAGCFHSKNRSLGWNPRERTTKAAARLPNQAFDESDEPQAHFQSTPDPRFSSLELRVSTLEWLSSYLQAVLYVIRFTINDKWLTTGIGYIVMNHCEHRSVSIPSGPHQQQPCSFLQLYPENDIRPNVPLWRTNMGIPPSPLGVMPPCAPQTYRSQKVLETFIRTIYNTIYKPFNKVWPSREAHQKMNTTHSNLPRPKGTFI